MSSRWADKMRKYRKSFSGRARIMWKTLQDRLRNDPSYAQRQCHFTKDEFYLWLFARADYLSVYSRWVESGFDRILVPTIDRLNNDGDYTFDNMQILSWIDNMKKPKKYLTLEARKAAEREWDRKKKANLTPAKKARLNEQARIRYQKNKHEKCKRNRERYALKKGSNNGH